MKHFDKQFGQQVINNLYAVFIGIVLSAAFTLNPDTLELAFVQHANWFVLSLLIVYYFVDWFSSVYTIRHDDSFTYIHLYSLVFANMILCITILLTIKNSINLFVLFGAYSFIVPFWDFIITGNKLKDDPKNIKVNFRMLTALRFILGLIMVWAASVSSILYNGVMCDDAKIVIYSLIVGIVFVKSWRMKVLFNLYGE